jgi:hypothetical protein
MLMANANNLTSTPLSCSFKSEIQNEPDSAPVDRKLAELLELDFLADASKHSLTAMTALLFARDAGSGPNGPVLG